MYSLECVYYTKEFKCIVDLIADAVLSGMDPDCYITKDGVSIGEKVSDYIMY